MFVTFYDFLSFENDVNEAWKSNMQKTKNFFFAILKVTDEYIRIRIN